MQIDGLELARGEPLGVSWVPLSRANESHLQGIQDRSRV